MPKLTIDDMEVTVEAGTSLLQAAEQLGIEVPRFCYHDRLSVAGNCRMCLMEVEGAPKLAASCTAPCGEDMKVHTKSEKVKTAQKGVMEMMLINHPLDCPICDQGGECDLQDQSVAYGFDRSRFLDNKRSVKNKDLGPLVKTTMTRCIHCTRCVRFGEEVAGIEELGVLNRGEHLEIGTYVEQMITSELSGNLVDVCPVGALTSKPYAFKARPWELTKTETIDVMDAVGSNIRVDSRGNEVLRVLPRLHEDVNEEWISDKTRHACDGLKMGRLDKPYLKNSKGKLKPVSWNDAFEAISAKIKVTDGSKIAAVVGDLCDCESIMALKDVMHLLGSPHLECRSDGSKFNPYIPSGYNFNTSIAGVEDADLIILIGTNPRLEAAMLNARIYKNWRDNKVKVAVIGSHIDVNYPYVHLGTGSETLQDLIAGKHDFDETLKNAKKPMLILGTGATMRNDGLAVHALACEFAEHYNMIQDDWNGFNLLHMSASRMGALALGFTPKLENGGHDLDGIVKASSKGNLDILYVMGADDLPFDKLGDDTFVIYQGHHGDKGAAHADVVLPSVAYTEKNATYINTEGRVQIARKATFPVGDAKEDWTILRSLSAYLGRPLPYDNLLELRERMVQENDLFNHVDEVIAQPWNKVIASDISVNKVPFKLPMADFYQTNVICRASGTMQECTDAFFSANIKKRRVNG